MFDRRLGLFVHWGIYSVNGCHEQERMRKRMPRAEYEKCANVHTADFVRKVRAAGLEFHVWVINHTVKSMLAFCRGAQTVTTDCAKAQMDEIRTESRKPW